MNKPKHNNFMFLEPGLGSEDVVPSYKVPVPSDIILYLYGPIGEEIDYVSMIHTIRYAEPGQEIVIHINSGGGSLSTCLAILNAIRSCEGNVTTVIDGEACSAAAMIWLAGHKKVISSKHVYLMLHQAGWTMGGKTAEHNVQVNLMNKVVGSLIEELGSNLLTKSEAKDLNKGVDIYITGSEIIERVGASIEPESAGEGEESQS